MQQKQQQQHKKEVEQRMAEQQQKRQQPSIFTPSKETDLISSFYILKIQKYDTVGKKRINIPTFFTPDAMTVKLEIHNLFFFGKFMKKKLQTILVNRP